jgi:ABC-type glycerol-3-phosphate transport system substrate-binding protein
MKKLLALSALTLLLAGCGQTETTEDDSSLTDMFGDESTTEDTKPVEPEETPYSVGPSEIPSDLVPNE